MPSDIWSEGGLWFVVFDVKDPGNSVVIFLVDVPPQRVIAARRVSLDLEHSVASVADVKLA